MANGKLGDYSDGYAYWSGVIAFYVRESRTLRVSVYVLPPVTLLPLRQFRHPDVAGELFQGDYDLPSNHLRPSRTFQYAAERTPDRVRMIHRKGRTGRPLRRRLQALRPEADKSIPLGEVGQQVAVRRPARLLR